MTGPIGLGSGDVSERGSPVCASLTRRFRIGSSFCFCSTPYPAARSSSALRRSMN